MVGVAKGRFRIVGRAVVVAVCWATLSAQPTANLRDIGARDAAAGYTPSHLHEQAILRGVVNSLAYRFPDYTLLAFEEGGFGAVIKVNSGDARLDGYRPGDEIMVRGVVAAFAGMPVILPESIAKIGVKPAPPPLEVSVRDLMGFRHLGLLVRTEIKAVAVGDTANGAYVSVDAPDRFLIFIPRAPNQAAVLNLRPGQTATVTGV